MDAIFMSGKVNDWAIIFSKPFSQTSIHFGYTPVYISRYSVFSEPCPKRFPYAIYYDIEKKTIRI